MTLSDSAFLRAVGLMPLFFAALSAIFAQYGAERHEARCPPQSRAFSKVLWPQTQRECDQISRECEPWVRSQTEKNCLVQGLDWNVHKTESASKNRATKPTKGVRAPPLRWRWPGVGPLLCRCSAAHIYVYLRRARRVRCAVLVPRRASHKWIAPTSAACSDAAFVPFACRRAMFLRRVLTSGVCTHATCCASTYIEVAGRFTMTLMHDALHFLETQLDDYKAAFAALETKYNQVQEQLFAEQERGRDLNQVQERLRDFECQLLAEQERRKDVECKLFEEQERRKDLEHKLVVFEEQERIKDIGILITTDLGVKTEDGLAAVSTPMVAAVDHDKIAVTKDTIAASSKGVKRKAAMMLDGKSRQRKAARRLTSRKYATLGASNSVRAAQVTALLSILEMASSVRDFRDRVFVGADAIDADFKTLIDNYYAKFGTNLIKENMYKFIKTLDVCMTMRDKGIAEFKADGCIIVFPFSSIKVQKRQLWERLWSELAQDFMRKYDNAAKPIMEPISTVYEVMNMSGFRCKISDDPMIRKYSQLGRPGLGKHEKKSFKQDYYVTDAEYFGENKKTRATKGR